MSIPRDIPAVDIVGVLKSAGLTSFQLTMAEAACVEETPGIGWTAFNKLFGGQWKSEWPRCSRFRGYSDFLCVDPIAQPFVPHTAGKLGLVFRLPTVIETPETEKHTFHVLSSTLQDGVLHYRGKYTIVPVPGILFHWSDQPFNVRILKICYSSDKCL